MTNKKRYNILIIDKQESDTTEYILDGERIIAEKESGVITKRYFYDGSGIAGMWYNGEKYYYRKNIQGDVVGVYDVNGTRVASGGAVAGMISASTKRQF